MNQGVKIQPTRHEEYVIQQSMVKKDKNKFKKTGERYGVNGIGFQGINCHSAIIF